MERTAHKVSIYDTTLRDGNQALGISLSLSDKLQITEKLNDLGIEYIEGGWPNPTNSIDTEYYKNVHSMNLQSKIAVFGSTRRPGVDASEDPYLKKLVETGAPVATIFGKSWDLHVKEVLKVSLSENLRMIYDSVSFLKKKQRQLFYDA